jgi:hypothetical protein
MTLLHVATEMQFFCLVDCVPFELLSQKKVKLFCQIFRVIENRNV